MKMSSGTMAHSVITLLNLDSSTLRESQSFQVSFSVWLTAPVGESLSLLVKYWRRRRERDHCMCWGANANEGGFVEFQMDSEQTNTL